MEVMECPRIGEGRLEGQEEAFRIQISRNSPNQVKMWVRKQDESFLGAEGVKMRQIVGHVWRDKWDALSGPLPQERASAVHSETFLGARAVWRARRKSGRT